MLKGHLPRVIYHQLCQYRRITRFKVFHLYLVHWPVRGGEHVEAYLELEKLLVSSPPILPLSLFLPVYVIYCG